MRVPPTSAIALTGLLVGCCLILASLVSTNWVSVSGKFHSGLFAFCNQTKCVAINLTISPTSEINTKGRAAEYKAVRGLVVGGLVTGLCGLLVSIGFVVDTARGRGNRNLVLLRSALVLNPLAGVIAILGAVVFGVTIFKEKTGTTGASLGYSFMMCIAGGGILAVSSIFIYLGKKKTVTVIERTRTPPSLRAIEESVPPAVACSSTEDCCNHPPPVYTPPSEQYLISLYHPPPAYDDDKSDPPKYESEDLLPPPYREDVDDIEYPESDELED